MNNASTFSLNRTFDLSSLEEAISNAANSLINSDLIKDAKMVARVPIKGAIEGYNLADGSLAEKVYNAINIGSIGVYTSLNNLSHKTKLVAGLTAAIGLLVVSTVACGTAPSIVPTPTPIVSCTLDKMYSPSSGVSFNYLFEHFGALNAGQSLQSYILSFMNINKGNSDVVNNAGSLLLNVVSNTKETLVKVPAYGAACLP